MVEYSFQAVDGYTEALAIVRKLMVDLRRLEVTQAWAACAEPSRDGTVSAVEFADVYSKYCCDRR